MISLSKLEKDRPVETVFRPLIPAELAIVIVNWNSADFVRQCIKSIQRNPPGFLYEIVVVDSGSFDGCRELLSREFPDVRFVQSQKNVGFATANNIGAGLTCSRFLLFLNPDTEIVGNALDRLVETLIRSNAGLAGARLLNSDGSIQTSCIQSFPTILNQVLDSEWLRKKIPRSRLWGMSALHGKDLSAVPVEVVSGACILMKRSLFQKLGGFDQRFFMYSEDLDICRRVQKAGQSCLYVPDAAIIHRGGGSSNAARSLFSVIMMRESIYRLLKIHRGALIAFCYRMAMGLSALVRLPLILAAMVARIMTARHSNTDPFRKWIAVLRWSVGMETWAKRQSSEGEFASSDGGIAKNCSMAPTNAQT